MSWQVYARTTSHYVTWFLGTRFPGTIPLVFVMGYPKSGTTWACQLTADYLQLPFPRYSLLPVGCPAVVHGHELVSRRYPRGVYVVRDGRDALVSQYFFLARPIPDGDRPRLTARQRRTFPGLVNKGDVAANIAAFVQRQMTHPDSSRAHWGDHVMSFFRAGNPGIALLRYEDLLADGAAALAAAMATVTGEEPDPDRARAALDKFSFARQAGRRPGEEDRASFLRKGQTGDWVNHFTREAAEIFDRHCGEALVRAGYETDRGWVDRVEGAS